MRTSTFFFTLALALALTLTACNSGDVVAPTPTPTPTTGTVSGTISLPPGTAGSTGNARVALYQSFDDWNNDRFVFQTAADGSGNYAISNIPPGTYYMDAWKDNDNSGTITGPDLFGVYGNFSAGGTTLTPIPLAAGQTQTVTFTITLVGGPALRDSKAEPNTTE